MWSLLVAEGRGAVASKWGFAGLQQAGKCVTQGLVRTLATDASSCDVTQKVVRALDIGRAVVHAKRVVALTPVQLTGLKAVKERLDLRDAIQSLNRKGLCLESDPDFRAVEIVPRSPDRPTVHATVLSVSAQKALLDAALETLPAESNLVLGSVIATQGSVLNEAMKDIPALVDHLILRSTENPDFKSRTYFVLVAFNKKPGSEAVYMDRFLDLQAKAKTHGVVLMPCAFRSADPGYAGVNFDATGEDPVAMSNRLFTLTQQHFLDRVQPTTPVVFEDYISTGSLTVGQAQPAIIQTIHDIEAQDRASQHPVKHVYTLGFTKGIYDGPEFSALCHAVRAEGVEMDRFHVHPHMNVKPTLDQLDPFMAMVNTVSVPEGLEAQPYRETLAIKLFNVAQMTDLLCRSAEFGIPIVDVETSGEGGNPKSTKQTTSGAYRLSGGNMPSTLIPVLKHLLVDLRFKEEDVAAVVRHERIASQRIKALTGESERELTWSTELMVEHPELFAEAVAIGVHDSQVD